MGSASLMTVTSLQSSTAWVKSNQKMPAILGGEKAYTGHWPTWPVWDSVTDEKKLLEVMRSGVWSRNKLTEEFEKKWAQTLGAKRSLAVVNGTNALNTSLAQLEIGWGDEVLVTSYTFIASVSSILFNGAIPVFVDVDPETFQMNPDKIEEKITSHTRAILPVHILGLPCDMERIMKIAAKHNLLVVEDACQAWLAEINGKKVGTPAVSVFRIPRIWQWVREEQLSVMMMPLWIAAILITITAIHMDQPQDKLEPER